MAPRKEWTLVFSPSSSPSIDSWISLLAFQIRNSPIVDYDALEGYRDFGGIRIEDDILVNKSSEKTDK